MRKQKRNKTRIAWVSFDFPPRQSSGVFRAIKLYKYLDKNRFEVDFITHGAAGRFDGAVLDQTLLAEVHPAPGIYRVPTIIPHDLLPRLKARLRGRRPTPAQSRAGVASAPDAGVARVPEHSDRPPRPARTGFRRSLYRWFALATYVPDHLFLWGWCAAVKALWLHLWRRYDVVYTTSYPESAHLAGFALRALGVRWVVDYRYGGPLWIKEVVGFRKPPLRDRFDLWFQRRVLTTADQVITQSNRIRADFCDVFSLDPARVEVIPSGYDEADFARTDPAPPPFPARRGEIHLLHLGALEAAADRERLQMLLMLDELASQLRARGHALVLHAVGSDVFQREQQHAAHLTYQRHGVVIHRDIPTYLRAADCFLLSTWTTRNGVVEDVKGFIPCKLWEYLRAGAPILMTGPKDEVWSIVQEAGVGVYLPLNGGPDAVASVAGELLDHLHRKAPVAPSVACYTWQSRAESVQHVFHRAVDASACG